MNRNKKTVYGYNSQLQGQQAQPPENHNKRQRQRRISAEGLGAVEGFCLFETIIQGHLIKLLLSWKWLLLKTYIRISVSIPSSWFWFNLTRTQVQICC